MLCGECQITFVIGKMRGWQSVTPSMPVLAPDARDYSYLFIAVTHSPLRYHILTVQFNII